MTITIYELLGLVKDGKAPKRIKYNDKIYIYYEAYAGYYEENHQGEYTKKFLTFRNEQYHKVLNDTVEILEEENKIEKLETCKIINTRDILELEMIINKRFADYTYIINQLIDEINSIKEKIK